MDISQIIDMQMQKAGQPLISKSTSTLTPPQNNFDMSILPLLIMAIIGGGGGGDKKGLGLPGNESWYGVDGGMGVGPGSNSMTPMGLFNMLSGIGKQSY